MIARHHCEQHIGVATRLAISEALATVEGVVFAAHVFIHPLCFSRCWSTGQSFMPFDNIFGAIAEIGSHCSDFRICGSDLQIICRKLFGLALVSSLFVSVVADIANLRYLICNVAFFGTQAFGTDHRADVQYLLAPFLLVLVYQNSLP